MELALKSELARMKEVGIHTGDREFLMDLREVQIDRKLSRELLHKFQIPMPGLL